MLCVEPEDTLESIRKPNDTVEKDAGAQGQMNTSEGGKGGRRGRAVRVSDFCASLCPSDDPVCLDPADVSSVPSCVALGVFVGYMAVLRMQNQEGCPAVWSW